MSLLSDGIYIIMIRGRDKNMKMKLSDIILLNESLKSIIDTDKKLKIDTLFKFKLLGIMKNLENPVANFDVIRNEKIREYGKEDENGNIAIVPEDNDTVKKFTDDLNVVLNSDVEVSIEKLKIKDVFNAGIPAEYLVKLYAIMEE